MLSNCVLVAIVKNEATNLAGGIEAYVERALALVALAVVCDTGSSDATLALLRRQADAPTTRGRLHVFADETFASFADARNRSLSHAHDVLRAIDADQRCAPASRWLFQQAPTRRAPCRARARSRPLTHFIIVDADEELDASNAGALRALLDASPATSCVKLKIQASLQSKALLHRKKNQGMMVSCCVRGGWP